MRKYHLTLTWPRLDEVSTTNSRLCVYTGTETIMKPISIRQCAINS